MLRFCRGQRTSQIMIGTTVAHYRISAAIGAGGLGAVYRATDSLWTARRTGGGAQLRARAACVETRFLHYGAPGTRQAMVGFGNDRAPDRRAPQGGPGHNG